MKSIRVKLWLGMMALVGIIIVLLWLFQIIFLDKFYSILQVNQITANANKLIKEIELQKDDENITISTQLMQQIDDFVYKKQLTVEIIDKSYRIAYQGSSGNNMSMPGMLKEVVGKAAERGLLGEDFKQEFTHMKFGYKFMILALPIHYDSGIKGAMLITMPMAAVKDTVDILKKQLILIIGILLITSLFISFRLSKRFSDPILTISKQAESYILGRFSTRTSDLGEDEIGQLAKRMNKMGEALMRNEVLQKEIISNVSHELRTPLTLIRGYAETLRDVTGENPDKRKKQLDIIVEETARLSNIVEDILNLSQLQSGAQILQKESFSLKEMLINIKAHYEIMEKANNLLIEKAIECEQPLLGDRKKIEQVFYNLIDNAFRHSKEGDIVEVAATQNRNHIKITVTDHGDGIAKEDLEHIFERYYRGKRTNGRKSNGTGLGLAIVKSILELHHMPLGVESELGKGTTFWFELEKDDSFREIN